MGGADGEDALGVGRGEQREGQNSGRDAGKVPQKLESRPPPVHVLLVRVGVPEKGKKQNPVREQARKFFHQFQSKSEVHHDTLAGAMAKSGQLWTSGHLGSQLE